ncbi:6-phosphogluconolactonase (EC, eukaryotic type [Olavius sp. associated proteobacterium Delta 1]|nr:6-phosphogluconolactonase (EC, eukaryotic type [Olavius sp. associated proteobacterium Delta 1]
MAKKNLHVEIKVVKDLDEISRTAADVVIHQANERGSSSGPFTLALSGGSTPRLLHNRLSLEASKMSRRAWKNFHFFWGDERHVPAEHPQSNYRMACETLLNSAAVPAQNIHRVYAEEPDAVIAAEKYERELQSFFNLNTGQLPRLDCVLLGVGTDGHTASLFPATNALKEKRRLVAANRVEKFQTHRITMTVPVFNNAALIIFLVSGKQKAPVLREILEGDNRPDLLPAQLIRPTNGRLIWLVDQAAAGCLSDSLKV